MINYIIFFTLIVILYFLIFFNLEQYSNNNLYYNNNISYNDIKEYKTLIIDTQYLKYQNNKLVKFLEKYHTYFQKIILLYTKKFNKSDILNKINDSSKLNLIVTEDNLTYFNIYFKEKT